MTSIPPTYSFDTYGASRPAGARPIAATPEARAASATDKVEFTSRPAATQNTPQKSTETQLNRLVAARVSTPVDFAPAARPAGSLDIYHHPADRNAAAVAVDLGRAIDVSG